MSQKQKLNQEKKSGVKGGKKARQDEQIIFQAKVEMRAKQRSNGKPTAEQFSAAIEFGMQQCPDTLSARSGIAVPVLTKFAAGRLTPSVDQMRQAIVAAEKMGFQLAITL